MMEMLIEKIKLSTNNKNVEFQKHALKRLVEEKLTVDIILEVIASGEVIKEYSDDKPYPSILILGYHNVRPVHVVCAYNSDADKTHIITNYEPTLEYYEPGFKVRRKEQ
jgi:hypothetical protein